MPRDEVEAAYFALLRARDELTALRRYAEYLADERRRIQRYVREGEALADQVDPRLRRRLRHTDDPLSEALTARLVVIADEEARMPDRITAAEAFVEECERDHATLRQGR